MRFSRLSVFAPGMSRTAVFFVFVPLLVGAFVLNSSAQDKEKEKSAPGTSPSAAAVTAEGQFLEETPNEQLRNLWPKIRQMLMQGKFSPGEDTIFNDYFENFEFKRWTQEKNSSRVADWRSTLAKAGASAKPGPPRDRRGRAGVDAEQ